jgi:hypothetical protein
MTAQPFEREQEPSVLHRIREGMEVYDRAGEQIGSVERIHFGAAGEHGRGAATPSAQDWREDSLVDVVAEAFASDEIPETLRARLLQNGFIRIDADGLFAADRYVMPDQIASVMDDRVVLRATRDELISR